jgi:hypothetical protein
MTYKYNVKGVGLDQIFDPYVSGTKAAITNYTVSGVDLKDIFAPIYLGTSAAVTNYKVKGADLNTIFAAYGTARYALPFNGTTFSGAYTSGNVTSNMLARATLLINADGTYSIVTIGNNVTTTAASGTWLPGGQSASDYQVQFSYSQISVFGFGPATFTNSAASYAACTSNQSIYGSATSLQTSAQDKGGHYTMTMLLKRISTGVVTTTTFEFDIESVGTG